MILIVWRKLIALSLTLRGKSYSWKKKNLVTLRKKIFDERADAYGKRVLESRGVDFSAEEWEELKGILVEDLKKMYGQAVRQEDTGLEKELLWHLLKQEKLWGHPPQR